MKTAITSLAILLSAGLMVSAPAMAAGSGDGSSSTVKKCKRGEVWNASKRKCQQKSSSLDKETIYQAGRDLAHAGRYDEAIDVLTIGADRGDKRILNYLGYSHRKAGRVEVGLTYYRQALEIDPEYTLVREYMGEALLQKGDLEGALHQLSEIRRLCQGRDCGEYQELSGHIADFINNKDS